MSSTRGRSATLAATGATVWFLLLLGGFLPGAPASILHSALQAVLLGLAVLATLRLAARPLEREAAREALERQNAEAEAQRVAMKLAHALEQLRSDPRLLCMCSWCKSIRDPSGEWRRLESYLEEHLKADFTHGACPECLRVEYPDLFGRATD